MKKLYNNQAGLTPVLFAAIIALLIGIGGGVWYFGVRDSGDEPVPATSSESESSEITASESMSDGEFSGGYFEAISRGTPLQCKFRVPEELARDFQVGEGDFYTDGVNNGFSMGEFKVDTVQITAKSIFTADKIYSWSEVPVAGAPKIGIEIDRVAAQEEFDSLSEEERQDAYDYRARYDFTCQPWTVDETKFQLPTDVDFRTSVSDSL